MREPAPIHNAIVSGTPEALRAFGRAAARPAGAFSRVRRRSAKSLSPCFLFVLPSADSRRVLEEMLPRFPHELGGGPITDLTHGLLWAAGGIDERGKPALRVVAGSRDAARLPRHSCNCRKGRWLPAPFAGDSKSRSWACEGTARIQADCAEQSSHASGRRPAGGRDLRCAQRRRRARRRPRAQCTNNEKQIALALHNYHDETRLLSAGLLERQGRQAALELARADLAVPGPESLVRPVSPGRGLGQPAQSHAHLQDARRLSLPGREGRCSPRTARRATWRPRGAAHDHPRRREPCQLRDITDGTSNTIIAIDAGDEHAVVWTKPDDWEFDPEPGIESIFKSHGPGGINAAVCRWVCALINDDDPAGDPAAPAVDGAGEVSPGRSLEPQRVRPAPDLRFPG